MFSRPNRRARGRGFRTRRWLPPALGLAVVAGFAVSFGMANAEREGDAWPDGERRALYAGPSAPRAMAEAAPTGPLQAGLGIRASAWGDLLAGPGAGPQLARATPAADIAQTSLPALPGAGQITPFTITVPQPAPTVVPAQAAEPIAGTVAIRAAVAPEEARVTFVWEKPVTVTSSVAGRELLLRFDRELRAPGLEFLPESLTGWVESVQQGYDSLLLRASRAVTFEIAAEGGTVTVVLRPPPPGAVLVDRPLTPDEDRRLKLLSAQLRLRLGEVRAAREDIRAVISAHGRSLAAVVALAEVEQKLGNWQRAAELYTEALELSPGDRGLTRALAALARDYGDLKRIDLTRQIVDGGDNQHIVTTTSRISLFERSMVELSSDRRTLELPTLRRPGGITEAFDSVRLRSEIGFVQSFDEEAASIRPALFLSSGSLGGGVSAERREGTSRTRIAAEYHRPYWELTEGIADGGTRDRLALTHIRTLDLEERWSATFEAAVNRFGLDDDNDLAHSFNLLAEVSYAISLERPFISIGYQADGEYVLGRETRTAGNGEMFAPLPLSTREVHGAILFAGGALTDYIDYSVFAGYNFDRYNFRGPQYGGELSYEPIDAFELGLRYSISNTSGRGTDGTFTQYGVFAAGRF